MLMVVVMAAAVFILVLIVVVAAAAIAVFVVAVMVMLMRLMLGMLHFALEHVLVHSLADGHTADLCPRRGDEARRGIKPLEQRQRGLYLLLGGAIGARQDYKVGAFHLIVEELTEVAHIHFALARIDNGAFCTYLRALNTLDGLCNVAELADAGRLDNNAVRLEIVDDLLERFCKIAHECAADAAGIHFGYLDTGVLEEPAVDRDLTELVLNKHKLFALVALGNELADKRGLACTEKTGKYIYSCHL